MSSTSEEKHLTYGRSHRPPINKNIILLMGQRLGKYFLMMEKFITFPQDQQLPSKEELGGKVYCKYHNS